jgi:hypothetical protein
MIRPAIVLALLLSSALMMRGVAGDWRKGMPTPTESVAKKSAPAGEASTLPQAKPLQPMVPGVLPDLKDGYLFNPERMLAGAEAPPSMEEKADDAGAENTTGIAAKMDDVTYAGSIIADNFSRAIIVYTEAAAKNKPKPPAQPAARSSKVKATPPPVAAAPGSEKHGQLEVGDVLDGYKVAEIQPDKLVFTKGDETVEKLLYDPEKKRQAPPPRAAALPPGGGGPPRPAGIQATTIGGTAPPVPPTPGTVNPPIPPAPGAVNPPTPPVPPAAKSPTSPTVTDTSPPTTPVRRMVISRQPSAAGRPDTSRVIRQTRGEGDEIAAPLPPGFGGNPNDSTAAPPTPEGEVSQ